MKNERQRQNYEAMEPSKKRMLLEKKQAKDTANILELQKKRAKQYKTMDSAKKQELSSKQAEKFKTTDAAQKEELLQKQKQKYCSKKNKNVNSCIETFKKNIKEGPYYICCVCNRILYKKSVLK